MIIHARPWYGHYTVIVMKSFNVFAVSTVSSSSQPSSSLPATGSLSLSPHPCPVLGTQMQPLPRPSQQFFRQHLLYHCRRSYASLTGAGVTYPPLVYSSRSTLRVGSARASSNSRKKSSVMPQVLSNCYQVMARQIRRTNFVVAAVHQGSIAPLNRNFQHPSYCPIRPPHRLLRKPRLPQTPPIKVLHLRILLSRHHPTGPQSHRAWTCLCFEENMTFDHTASR